MKTFKKNSLFFYSCLLLLGLIVSTGSYADHGHGPGQGQGQQNSEKIKKVIALNQNYYAGGGGNRINLLNYLYNDYQLQNAKLKKVVIKAQSNAGFGKAILKINGQRVGSPQTVPSNMSRTPFNVQANLGQVSFSQINNMTLKLKGNFYVEKIILVFEKSFYVNVPAKIMGKEVNKFVSYSEKLKVRKLLGLNSAYNGQKVKFVSITTQGHSSASVQLMINGNPVGPTKNLSRRKNFIKLQVPQFLGGVLGQDIRRLQVQVNGQTQIISIMVGLVDSFNIY